MSAVDEQLQRVLAELAERIDNILVVWTFGSAADRPLAQVHDIDLLCLVRLEPSAAEATQLKTEFKQLRSTLGKRIDIFIMPLEAFWGKLVRGDYQLLSILAGGHPVGEHGCLSFIQELVRAHIIAINSDQIEKLMAYALQSLGTAVEEAKPWQQITSLRTAVRSALQAAMIAEDKAPLPFSVSEAQRYLAEWAGETLAAKYQAFETYLREVARDPRSVSQGDVQAWQEPSKALVDACRHHLTSGLELTEAS